MNSAELFRKALEEFKRDVEIGSFPSDEESYG
jgi:ketopantoate hydroxymethyltransferase